MWQIAQRRGGVNGVGIGRRKTLYAGNKRFILEYYLLISLFPPLKLQM
jgi:hypothetical protein